MIKLSEQGRALRDILVAVEVSDKEMKRLGDLLLQELAKKEALMVCFNRLVGEMK